MPGPTTEVLNSEIKELRDGVRVDIDRLRTDIHQANEPVIRLTTEVAIFKSFVGVGLILLITNILGGAWWAATITANVGHINAVTDQRLKSVEVHLDDRFKEASTSTDLRFKAIETRADDRLAVINDHFKAIETRLDKMDARFDKMDARFDRFEAMLTKALAKP